MTSYTLGPPSPDGPEFASFLVAHGIVPRSEDEVDYLRLLLWYEQLGGDPARLSRALAEHVGSTPRPNPPESFPIRS